MTAATAPEHRVDVLSVTEQFGAVTVLADRTDRRRHHLRSRLRSVFVTFLMEPLTGTPAGSGPGR